MYVLTWAWFWAWLAAFVFTQATEMPVYLAGSKLLGGPQQAVSPRLAFAFSAVTHPFVWYLFPPLGDALSLGYLATSALSEVFAWLVEAAMLWRWGKLSWPRAVLLSLLANAFSVVTGTLSRHYLGFP